MKHLDKGIVAVFDSISSLSAGDDKICLLQQLQEQLSDFKSELSDIRRSLLSFSVEDDRHLNQLLTRTEKGIFDCSLEIKKLLHSHPTPSSMPDLNGVKLPKLDVPTFDGHN